MIVYHDRFDNSIFINGGLHQEISNAHFDGPLGNDGSKIDKYQDINPSHSTK